MATLLQFDLARRPQAPRGGALKGPAEILFFTGIRYERQPDSATEKPALRKRRKSTGRNTGRNLAIDSEC